MQEPGSNGATMTRVVEDAENGIFIFVRCGGRIRVIGELVMTRASRWRSVTMYSPHLLKVMSQVMRQVRARDEWLASGMSMMDVGNEAEVVVEGPETS